MNIAGGGRTVGIRSSIASADVNGVHAEDEQDVVVTGSSVEDCGNWPMISKEGSNNWVMVDSAWSDNRFDTVPLANDDNMLAFNSVG